MNSLNKKAVTVALPVLISLIFFSILILLDIGLFGIARAAVNESEFVNCKYSIDLSQGVDLDSEALGITYGVQPIPIECRPLIIDDDLLNGAKNQQEISTIILNKARVAWWATGKGQYQNIWKDSGKKDKLCKVMYYFELDEETKKALDGGISDSRFRVYLENQKLNKIEDTLYNYILSSTGSGKRYHILFESDGIPDDDNPDDDIIKEGVVYGIIISSNPEGFNEIIFSTIPEGPLETVKIFINNKFRKENKADRDLCDEMLDFNDNRVRVGI